MEERKEKLTIRQLAIHYIDAYHLSLNMDNKDPFGNFTTQLQRIMERTKINQRPLWDLIKPPKGVRKISIELFEKYCFLQWADYIQNHYDKKEYDSEALAREKAKYIEETENNYGELAQRIIDSNNAALEDRDPKPDDDILAIFSTKDEDLQKMGCRMMLEALYNLFFEGFDWNQLMHDKFKAEITNTGYNADVTADTVRALKRLQDYTNYVGKKRNAAIIYDMKKSKK